jgi:nucleotidyltransferase substrate binding protein (TIGR01987 family)
MALKLDTLKKALNTLEQAIRLHHEERDKPELSLALRDSVIQRFEYTYELAWKVLQRWVGENVDPESAQPRYSRKELYRVAARWGLIEDASRWFEYNKARNVSAHTYDEDNAKQVFQASLGIVDDIKYLLKQIEQRND